MFVRWCGQTEAHEPHPYEHLWKKTALPMLLHPEQYPDQWIAFYQCHGTEIEAWTVKYLHADCTPCEACADMAVESAKKDEVNELVWRELGQHGEIMHMAEVERL